MVQPQPIISVPLAQRRDQPCPRRVHGERFKPSLRTLRIDDDDLGAVCFVETPRHRLGDAPRGEILAFGIDEAFGARDLLEIELLHFQHRALAVHLGRGARDRDIDIGELHGQGDIGLARASYFESGVRQQQLERAIGRMPSLQSPRHAVRDQRARIEKLAPCRLGIGRERAVEWPAGDVEFDRLARRSLRRDDADRRRT